MSQRRRRMVAEQEELMEEVLSGPMSLELRLLIVFTQFVTFM